MMRDYSSMSDNELNLVIAKRICTWSPDVVEQVREEAWPDYLHDDGATWRVLVESHAMVTWFPQLGGGPGTWFIHTPLYGKDIEDANPSRAMWLAWLAWKDSKEV